MEMLGSGNSIGHDLDLGICDISEPSLSRRPIFESVWPGRKGHKRVLNIVHEFQHTLTSPLFPSFFSRSFMAPKAHRNLPDIDWSSNPPSDADAPPSDGEALPSDVDAPPSGDETPPAGVAKPTALRPCSFKPQCSQQCPDLEINPSSPSFCQCGHLGSLHLPNNAQSRWLATIRAARSASHSRSASGSRLPPPLAQARAEVLSGFRDRAASTSSLRKSSGKAPAHEKAPSSEATVKGKGKSKSQGKGKGKGRELKEEVIRAIYLVPDAWLGHTMVSFVIYILLHYG